MGRDGDFIKKILTATDMENLSLDVSVNKFSRDLLQRFRGSVTEFDVLNEKKDEEIELNLGLSLGGRFGVDKSCSKNSLVRSSSIAVCSTLLRDDDNDLGESRPVTGLVRTSSMPVETEEDWRKRKELQTLRRMEAKRRRSEKQRDFIRADKEIGGTYGVAMAKGSVESKGGSSSSVSDLEANVLHGSSSEPSPTSILSLKANNLDVGSSGTKPQENTNKISDIAARSPCKKSDTSRAGGEKVGGTNAIEDMPCVFTMGDGPNGRRVDGILYKYGKGEEVRIMCICCGKFHSPAEFIKHAGGTDVDHPLKHIVVNAYAPSLL